jgi:hypothetical protein
VVNLGRETDPVATIPPARRHWPRRAPLMPQRSGRDDRLGKDKSKSGKTSTFKTSGRGTQGEPKYTPGRLSKQRKKRPGRPIEMQERSRGLAKREGGC